MMMVLMMLGHCRCWFVVTAGVVQDVRRDGDGAGRAIQRRFFLLGQRQRRRGINMPEMMIGRRRRWLLLLLMIAGMMAGGTEDAADAIESGDIGRGAGERRWNDVSRIGHRRVHDRRQRRVHDAGRAMNAVAVVAVVVMNAVVGGVEDVVQEIDVGDKCAVDQTGVVAVAVAVVVM